MRLLKLSCCFLFAALLARPDNTDDAGVLGNVDMKNANFSLEASDLAWQRGQVRVPITRAFNSRSLFQGMFGFGWCSNLETVLKQDGDEWVLKVCGDGAELRFCPKAQQEWTSALNGVIRRESGKLIYTDEKGEVTEFAEDGHMLSLHRPTACKLDLEYEDGLLRSVRACGVPWFSIRYSGNGKIKEIRTFEGRSIYYQTGIGGALLSVRDGEMTLCRYEYDQLNNLTYLYQPSKKPGSPDEARLTYDVNRDWLVRFRAGACEEQYTYLPEPKTSDRYSSHVKRICNGRVEQDFQMRLWYGSTISGCKSTNRPRDYLARSELIERTFLRTKTIEEIGNPQFDTLLQSRTQDGEKTVFIYDQSGNLLRTDVYGKNGTLIKTERSSGSKTAGVNARNCNFCSSSRDPVTGITGQ